MSGRTCDCPSRGESPHSMDCVVTADDPRPAGEALDSDCTDECPEDCWADHKGEQ